MNTVIKELLLNKTSRDASVLATLTAKTLNVGAPWTGVTE